MSNKTVSKTIFVICAGLLLIDCAIQCWPVYNPGFPDMKNPFAEAAFSIPGHRYGWPIPFYIIPISDEKDLTYFSVIALALNGIPAFILSIACCGLFGRIYPNNRLIKKLKELLPFRQ